VEQLGFLIMCGRHIVTVVDVANEFPLMATTVFEMEKSCVGITLPEFTLCLAIIGSSEAKPKHCCFSSLLNSASNSESWRQSCSYSSRKTTSWATSNWVF